MKASEFIKDIDIETINGRINFNFKSEMQKDSFLVYKKEFQNIYNCLGANKILEFEVDKTSSIDISKEFENEVNQIVKNSMPSEAPKGIVRDYNDSPKKSFIEHDAEDVEIYSLKQNDKNVYVTGKIFALEDKEYNNRLIIFRCSSCKAFYFFIIFIFNNNIEKTFSCFLYF